MLSFYFDRVKWFFWDLNLSDFSDDDLDEEGELPELHPPEYICQMCFQSCLDPITVWNYQLWNYYVWLDSDSTMWVRCDNCLLMYHLDCAMPGYSRENVAEDGGFWCCVSPIG